MISSLRERTLNSYLLALSRYCLFVPFLPLSFLALFHRRRVSFLCVTIALSLVLGYNENTWGGQVRKSYDYYNQNSNNRGDYQQQHEGGKIEQRMQNLRLDGSSSAAGAGSGNKGGNSESSGPKKMTWATIASQPAKPQISTTNTTTKKKGPGMPPPPMIPGKHNIDLNDGWDTPKNIVPPSPPVITAPPPVDLSTLDKQSNANFDGQPAWPTPEQAVSQNNQQSTQNSNNNHSQAPSSQQQPPHHGNSNNRGPGSYHQYNQNKYDKYDKYDKYENNSGSSGNNNYHGRQYNQNSGPNQQHYNNSSNYNDYQKPYHQHPHQMPSASSHQQNQSGSSGGPITRASMQPPQQVAAAAAPPPPTPTPQTTQPTSSQQSSSSSQSVDFNKQLSEESILEQLRVKNQYNPSELDLSLVDKAR
jgi:hypothetical protein